MRSPFMLLLPVELVQEQEIGREKSRTAECPGFSSVLECFLLVRWWWDLRERMGACMAMGIPSAVSMH